MVGSRSVGSLLADIAHLISDGLRIFCIADKQHWGLDEHEQLRALQEVLDEAKEDFQYLSHLVNGQPYYESDRNHDSLKELSVLLSQFRSHILDLKDWSRSGGPIDATWIRHTHSLRKDLHRAQCRAAMRIFASDQESSQRCLGAYLVRRAQTVTGARGGARRVPVQYDVDMCAKIGSFERFGDEDKVFICDFCDGHLIWDDLESAPTRQRRHDGPEGLPRSSTSSSSGYPHWQAVGVSLSDAQPKTTVFAPVAIANHVAPQQGDWLAKLLCAYCDEAAGQPDDADDEEGVWRPEQVEFDGVAELQEHLEWHHTETALAMPLPTSGSCRAM